MSALSLDESEQTEHVAADTRGEATRQRILDAAQKLFSEHGSTGVSLRAITSEAGANSAAANYHFGSKLGLLEAVFARHAVAIADEREALLSDCRDEPGRPPLLEQLIRAFMAPGMRGQHGGTGFARFRGRMLAENNDHTRELYARHFNDSTGRFLDALHVALPDLPKTDLYWRFHVMLGAMIYTLANPGRIQILSDGACDPSNIEEALDHLVPLMAQMFLSPEMPADNAGSPGRNFTSNEA